MGKSITQSKIEANELTTVWLLVLALLGRAKTVLRNNKTTRKKTDGKKEERERAWLDIQYSKCAAHTSSRGWISSRGPLNYRTVGHCFLRPCRLSRSLAGGEKKMCVYMSRRAQIGLRARHIVGARCQL